MMRFALLVAAACAVATPALAEQYNIVCPVAAMGTEQVGTATIAKGYIFSLDFDAKKACVRVNNACAAEDFTVADGVAQLSGPDGQSAQYDIASDMLTVEVANERASGKCRRAPFTGF
jgi:hypothetical protein